MNRTLGERHIVLADHTRTSRNMSADTLVESIARTWTRPMADSSRDYCDFASAISGDDLARLRADDYRIVKPIGRQRGLWSDVRHASQAAAA